MRLLDDPIQSISEDLLERADLAKGIAADMQNHPSTKESGLVVGIMGPWGCGKTSLLNLIRGELESNEVRAIEFNPWIFSGAEELVTRFFVEVQAQLKRHEKLKKLATSIAEYGAMLEPISPYFKLLKLVGVPFSQEKGTHEIQHEIKSILQEQEKPLVVIIDDLDRLTNPEIREIFKLVRLTASFPNLIYLLAFDRSQIERAFNDTAYSGSDYLGKIVQIGIDMPSIPNELLERRIIEALDQNLQFSQFEVKFDQRSWPDIFHEIIRPSIRNIRDLRRYTCSAMWTANRFNGRVSITDLLALEAIRLFMPTVFHQLGPLTKLLTSSRDSDRDSFDANGESQSCWEDAMEKLREGANRDEIQIIDSMIYRLFPMNSHELIGNSTLSVNVQESWFRNRRVASESILRLYLEQFETAEMKAHNDSTQLLELNDTDSIIQFLSSLEPSRRRDAVSGLDEHDLSPTIVQAQSMIIALHRMIPSIPSKMYWLMEFKSHAVVNRIVYKILTSVSTESVATLVEEILPQLETLSSKMWLVIQVGHRKDRGHKLVNVNEAEKFEIDWLREYNLIPASVLAKEWDLIRILLIAREMSQKYGQEFSIDESPELTLAILRSSRDDVVSHSIDSRNVQREPRLDWDTLVHLYGDEDVLRCRIECIEDSMPMKGEDLEALELAKRYLGGWRPSIFDESNE